MISLVEHRILITSIGSNTAINIIKSIKSDPQLRDNCYIIGTDIYEERLSAGSHLVDRFHKVPPANDQCYLETILSIIQKTEVSCVIPIHDREIELISKLSIDLPEITFFAVNKPEVIELCNNKLSTYELIKSLEIRCPVTYSFNAFQNSTLDEYPIIVKPLYGVSSRNQFICESKDDLDSISKYNLREYIVQEYLKNSTEYTVDCYSSYRTKKFIDGIARERIEVRAGISIKSKTVNQPLLIEACEKILNSIEFRGASNIQFLKYNDLFYFLEINPRFSGAGILSFQSGLHSPKYTLMESQGEAIIPQTEKKEFNIYMTRHYSEAYHKNEGNNI